MAEPEDLLSKADALMARHRPGRTGGGPYPEIPVLDEVVDFSAEVDDVPVLTELVEVDRELSEREPAAPEPVEPGPQHEEQLAQLAESMRATLLAELQPEIDVLIEERLKEGLAPLVEKLFEDLRGELQSISRQTLSDAVHTAVARELERRKSGD